MNRLTFAMVAMLAISCGSKKPPVIDSFAADKTDVLAGDPVQLSWSASGAVKVTILPAPGVVTASPVIVNPGGPTTYTLRAENEAGAATRDLTVNVRPRPVGVRIASFSALPGQVPPGQPVTLAWVVSGAKTSTLNDGTTPAVDVTTLASTTVNPGTTTTYTLTVVGETGANPPSASAKAVARVATAARIASFTATPPSSNQGEAVTLRWDGTFATGWKLSDGTTTVELGPAKTRLVRPLATTTYTLTAIGLGGNDTMSRLVTVAPSPGTTLLYTPPALTGQRLELVADACSAPCGSITLRLIAPASTALRGVALDLPLDSTKVSLDPATLVVNASAIPGSPPAAKAVLGTGALQNTLVFGAAIRGTGSAPAADVTIGAGGEVARFKLALVPAGGKGVVFDGATAAGAANYVSRIQDAQGKTQNSIAIGKLEVQ